MNIDWAYLRKGWTSCKNAQEFLGKAKINPTEVVDARLTRINAEQAWQMLQSATTVTVAKGQKFQRFEAVASQKDELLKAAMGPSGNLRAPTYRVGQSYVIGFNPQLYADWLK